MVDFRETSTVTTPFTEVVKLTILQRRNDCIEAIEFHKKKVLSGFDLDNNMVKMRIFSLWLEIGSGFQDINNENLGLSINDTVDLEELINIFEKIDAYLYKIRLTKIASFKSYDTTDMEAENEANEG